MKFIRISAGFLGVVMLMCCMFLFRGGIKSNSPIKTLKKPTIITLWHVDTFEGGQGSRRQFLLKIAREFEKYNSNVLVAVSEYSVEGVEQAIKQGRMPDMISYANGVTVKNLKEINLNLSFSAGEIDGKAYSLPWCRGNYVLIAKTNSKINLNNNQIENLIVSQGEFTQPLCAFAFEKLSAKNMQVLPSQDAFYSFLSSKDSILLGTQRDIVRANNLDLGISIKPLTKFNDLYQYISITTDDNIKNKFCQAFLSVLFSKENQLKLSSLCMQSRFYKCDYQSEHLKLLQQTESFLTFSPFVEGLTLKNAQQLSWGAVNGNLNDLDKLKNLTV